MKDYMIAVSIIVQAESLDDAEGMTHDGLQYEFADYEILDVTELD